MRCFVRIEFLLMMNIWLVLLKQLFLIMVMLMFSVLLFLSIFLLGMLWQIMLLIEMQVVFGYGGQLGGWQFSGVGIVFCLLSMNLWQRWLSLVVVMFVMMCGVMKLSILFVRWQVMCIFVILCLFLSVIVIEVCLECGELMDYCILWWVLQFLWVVWMWVFVDCLVCCCVVSESVE